MTAGRLREFVHQIVYQSGLEVKTVTAPSFGERWLVLNKLFVLG